MAKKVKNIVGYLFAVLAIVCSITFTYNLFFGKIDKVSAEWQLQLLFGSIAFVFIVYLALMAVGILKSKRWVFYFHSFAFILWIGYLTYFLLTNPSMWEGYLVENSLAILTLFGLPICIEIYLFKIKNSLLTN